MALIFFPWVSASSGPPLSPLSSEHPPSSLLPLPLLSVCVWKLWAREARGLGRPSGLWGDGACASLCTDRQAQDRSFRQSRPHNPSLKHRNRQGNHWHLRHSTEEGEMVPNPSSHAKQWRPWGSTSQHSTAAYHTGQSPEQHTQQPLARVFTDTVVPAAQG